MSDRAIQLLESIDSGIKKLLAALASNRPPNQASATKSIANDADLDSKWGDPEVRFDPRDWTGPSFKKRKMSDCPADYLDLYADAKEYFGRKAEEEGKTTSTGKPAAQYEFKDAARARGWAARIRSGRHVQTTQPVNGWPDAQPAWAGEERVADDDIPF
jgi:hypothetical protein